MKKRIICIAFAVALVLSIAVVAYAATDGFNMSYLPGTSDTVTNMPDNDSGIGGETYNVSSAVPQREGYKFLGWKLDYEVIAVQTSYTVKYLEEGTEKQLAEEKVVTDQTVGTTIDEYAIEINGYDLVSDGLQSKTLVQNAAENVFTFYYKKSLTDYTVKYLEEGTEKVLAPDKVVKGQTVGTTIGEDAIEINGYDLVSDGLQSKTLVQNAAENVFTFYYQPKMVSYIVRYLDLNTMEPLADDKVSDEVTPGTVVVETAKEIEDYRPLNYSIEWEVQEGDVKIFIYYYVGGYEVG